MIKAKFMYTKADSDIKAFFFYSLKVVEFPNFLLFSLNNFSHFDLKWFQVKTIVAFLRSGFV